MILPIRLNPAAKLDYFSAALWYEEQRPGLGGEFREAIKKCYGKIQESPGTWPVLRDNFRALSAPPFPYRVVYSVEADGIRVWAVFHKHRDPQVLESRLTGKPS